MLCIIETEEGLILNLEEPALDISVVDTCRRQLMEISDGNWPKVMVNLKGVDFIDSSGLGLLVTIHKYFGKPNSPVILLNPKPVIMDLLETFGLHRIFLIRED